MSNQDHTGRSITYDDADPRPVLDGHMSDLHPNRPRRSRTGNADSTREATAQPPRMVQYWARYGRNTGFPRREQIDRAIGRLSLAHTRFRYPSVDQRARHSVGAPACKVGLVSAGGGRHGYRLPWRRAHLLEDETRENGNR